MTPEAGAVLLPLALRCASGAVWLDAEGCDVPPGACRVWLQRLDIEAAASSALLPLLCPEERARADAFRAQPARDRFVQVRAALRLLLGRCLGVPGADIGFVYGAFGKPQLAGGGPWRFNVAHSGDYAVLAVAHGHEVGVDIEQQRALPELDALARMVFSPAESARWQALPAAERLPVFFAIWAAKEAVAKAAGQGLQLQLSALQVGLAPGLVAASVAVGHLGAPRAYRLERLPAPAGYAAALARGEPAS